jgi:biopolymer transport protein ExbD
VIGKKGNVHKGKFMNRYILSLLLLSLAGCQFSEGGSPSSPAMSSDIKSGQLVVELDMNNNMRVNGWTITQSDLPELVKQWHITSAVVRGQQFSKFSEALKVQAALRAAGVSDVSIAE